MGQTFDVLDEPLIEFIEQQHVFFVATAPLSDQGHVNLSPKGLDTFAVTGPKTFVYADFVGSGVETVAHLQENGRICILFCAFSGAPRILRLHGRGDVIPPGHPDYEQLHERFPKLRGLRSFIRVHCQHISDSCGFGVPLYDYQGDRTELVDIIDQIGEEGVRKYQHDNNRESLDGLPGLLPEAES